MRSAFSPAASFHVLVTSFVVALMDLSKEIASFFKIFLPTMPNSKTISHDNFKLPLTYLLILSAWYYIFNCYFLFIFFLCYFVTSLVRTVMKVALGRWSIEQDCIPVGCVLPTCCPYLPACTAPRGVCSWGCLPLVRGGGLLLVGGAYLWCRWGACLWFWEGIPAYYGADPPPVNRMADRQV